MIRIENVETYGWRAALRGMRNPKNSWDRSDTEYINNPYRLIEKIGEKDLELAQRLADAGPVHGKFMRMITVTCDITAPRYWWIEFDTYKVGTVSDSCSTMHKITERDLTLDDFSHEHLFNKYEDESFVVKNHSLNNYIKNGKLLGVVIDQLNIYRELYIETKDKRYWWQMIQLLPQSFNQRRTVQMNYAVLKNMYEYRKDHKLDEWRDFCAWIEGLPYSELITGVRS